MKTENTIKPLDRHDWGATFTLAVYSRNGAHVRTFNVTLDAEDGSWDCADPAFYEGCGMFAGLAESAQWEFNETGAQTGVYKVIEFDSEPDADGAQFAWVLSAN